jgi:hypothetical protein
MGPSRARSVFSRRRRHETDASPPPLRPYIRIFVIKHAFPALAALAVAKGAAFDDDASRRRASFAPAPARAKILISIAPASRSSP